MILNQKKTKCLLFIISKTQDFMPELTVDGENFLEVIYKVKLVGLVITSDMTWNAHVDYTIGRVNKILWQLIRFKQYRAPRDKLLEYYTIKIRSILMFGAVCFHSALTLELRQRLELQQKRSLAIILGSQYRTYDHARTVTNLPTLEVMREEACIKWAIKAQANPQHTNLFPINNCQSVTRNKKKFTEYKCHGA
jgi:hypothetical protein